MLQPFERFQELYIPKLVSLKKFYLVSQTYTRAYNHFAEVHPVDVLVTDYDDVGLAKIHYNAVNHDKYAAIIDLTNDVHRSKLISMLMPTSKYAVYWSIVRDVDELQKRLDYKYKDNMRRYISSNTNWRIAGDEKIKPSFQVTFGELYIILKRGAQTLRVKFDEIEKA
jgi:hypothetical protein